MKFKLLLICLLAILPELKAQKRNNFKKTDKLALQLPDSLTASSATIAKYITANFFTETDKARAIYAWIAHNIQYDYDNMYAINFYQNQDEVIDEVLRTRKGVCMHYAALFTSIANKVNIKSIVVHGYTKQNGFVDYIPHTWSAALIDSSWYLFDPTWGSGYVQNSEFIKQIDNTHFKAKPEKLIKSHMPFDPLWQFLNYPVTNQEFYDGKTVINKTKPYFNFTDTLQVYEAQNDTDKLVSASIRIRKNGIRNSLGYERLKQFQREIEYLKEKKATDLFNAAVNNYNKGIYISNRLHRSLNFVDKELPLDLQKCELQEMLDLAARHFTSAQHQLQNILDPTQHLSESIKNLNQSITKAFINLNEYKGVLHEDVAVSR